MNLKYIDVDTREIIDEISDPSLVIYKVPAENFAIKLGATIIRITPADNDYEWTIELKIPVEVRQRQTPLPGERVRFAVNLVSQGFVVSGIYQHKKKSVPYCSG